MNYSKSRLCRPYNTCVVAAKCLLCSAELEAIVRSLLLGPVACCLDELVDGVEVDVRYDVRAVDEDEGFSHLLEVDVLVHGLENLLCGDRSDKHHEAQVHIFHLELELCSLSITRAKRFL